MKIYYDGYHQSHQDVLKMNKKELLDLLDALWGRDNLPEDYSLEELRSEALAQHKKEWMTPEGKEYIDSHVAIAKEMMKMNKI